MWTAFVEWVKLIFSDWIGRISGVGSVVTMFAAIYFDWIKQNPQSYLWILAGSCFLIASFWVWKKEYDKLRTYETKHPNLLAQTPTNIDVLSTESDGRTTKLVLVKMLRLPIKNTLSKVFRTTDAKNVITTVTIFDFKDDLLCRFEGRYADSPQLRELAQGDSIKERLLRTNFVVGESRELDIGFTSDEDEYWYPYNHENQFFPRPPTRRFGVGEYRVVISLEAEDVNEIFEFKVKHKGRNQPLEVVALRKVVD